MERECIILENADIREKSNPVTYLHTTKKGSFEDPHHADCLELPEKFEDQITTRKMVCYLIVTVIFLIIITYIMNLVMFDYLFYAKDSGFPGPILLVSGTLISFIALAYLTYHITGSSHHPTFAFWAFIIALLAYTFAIINLAVRTEYYVKNINLPNNGSIWILIAIFASLGLLYVSSQVGWGVTILSLIPLSWFLYFLYEWWTKTESKR